MNYDFHGLDNYTSEHKRLKENRHRKFFVELSSFQGCVCVITWLAGDTKLETPWQPRGAAGRAPPAPYSLVSFPVHSAGN
jgi:hypothetical protein